MLSYPKLFFLLLQVIVTVNNGLVPTQLSEVISVDYLKATPVFNQTTYDVQVSENTPPNSPLFTAHATSAKQIGDLVYKVIGMFILK